MIVFRLLAYLTSFIIVHFMKTYLEIKVPIKYDDAWFEELRGRFSNLHVRWQKDYYHITLVFVNDTPKLIDLCPILKKHFDTALAPELTFDHLGVFDVCSGMHIIHLTASEVPERFLTLIESVRADMKAAGCVILSDFLMHVTLGRLKDYNIQLSELRSLADSFPMPPLSMALTDVDYREFRGKTIYETQLPYALSDVFDKKSVNCSESPHN